MAGTDAEHRLTLRVYYEDTDFTGVVYHANYLRFLERGRTESLRALGVAHSALFSAEDPCAFVVTRMEIDFRTVARIDDELVVCTRFQAVRGPRILVTQRILREIYTVAEASVSLACITPGGRPRRPPSDLVKRLEGRLFPDERKTTKAVAGSGAAP